MEVGAFVETSRSNLADGVLARHLAYIGDATVGARANISAGAITANFDGRNKGRTTIGANAMIGAGSILIAPVAVGDRATVGAGAVVPKNHDVPAGEDCRRRAGPAPERRDDVKGGAVRFSPFFTHSVGRASLPA